MNFNTLLEQPAIAQWRAHLSAAITKRIDPKKHGDLPAWLDTLNGLPSIKKGITDLNLDRITITSSEALDAETTKKLHDGLYALKPWRKGPYQIFGVHIDSEWRSDWKWQRLEEHISDLQGRKVLDVGCGNGYHCWRILGAGATSVLGIDPSMRFLVQHLAIQKYLQSDQFNFLPIGIEDMPTDMPYFDSVFSMGVLYHRRNPVNHLLELSNLLRPGGELILETLVVESATDGILRPSERYAMMRNVWSIMTIEMLAQQLSQAGFVNIRCINRNQTTLEEQRRTDWMQFHSLEEFLDPLDQNKTIEGYPAPERAIFIAEKPE